VEQLLRGLDAGANEPADPKKKEKR